LTGTNTSSLVRRLQTKKFYNIGARSDLLNETDMTRSFSSMDGQTSFTDDSFSSAVTAPNKNGQNQTFPLASVSKSRLLLNSTNPSILANLDEQEPSPFPLGVTVVNYWTDHQVSMLYHFFSLLQMTRPNMLECLYLAISFHSSLTFDGNTRSLPKKEASERSYYWVGSGIALKF
jgi:hypothetical protein